MEIVYPVCCGIDVHHKQLVACLRKVEKDGKVKKEIRQFNTTMSALKDLLKWLKENECPIVAMESTGVYWKPVYHILNQKMNVIVGNARDMRRRPGNKTDKTDSEWISELLAHGLIAPCFIPTPQISALRDLNRMRATLVQERSQSKNRIHKVLEDTNIKLSTVVSDLLGVTSRRILDALIAGERNPQTLAKLARGSLIKKIPQLELALEGQFTAHHAKIIKISLALIDALNFQIAEIDVEISRLMTPLQKEAELLKSIPGVNETSARVILSEIGTDMSRFGSDKRLSAWSGMSPGNNESGGKRKKAKTRKGNRWLRRILVQCAWATRKTDTFLGHTFTRWEYRIGGKKAAMATAHKIIVITYHLLTTGSIYDEKKYVDHTAKQKEHRRKNAVKNLERMGFQVSLTPA